MRAVVGTTRVVKRFLFFRRTLPNKDNTWEARWWEWTTITQEMCWDPFWRSAEWVDVYWGVK